MLRWAILPALVVVFPPNALACMEEPLPNAIVFAKEPKGQAGTVPVRLKVGATRPQTFETSVVIEAGPTNLVGQAAILIPENLGSCTGIGRREGFAVVRVMQRDGGIFLTGLAYERSWLDWIWTFLGWEPYSSPSSYAPPQPPQASL